MFYKRSKKPTNRDKINIFILFDSPQARIPKAANKTADWLAALRPIASLRRP